MKEKEVNYELRRKNEELVKKNEELEQNLRSKSKSKAESSWDFDELYRLIEEL